MRILCVLVCLSAIAGAHEPDEDHDHGLTAPVLVERAEPAYPEAARKSGLGGVVGLELTVAADGSVTEIKLLKPAGFGFDEAAIAAARRFRFKPATHDGRPIAATVLFDQQFVVRPHLTAAVAAEPEAEQAPPLAAGSAAPSYESVVVARGPTSAASSSSIRNLDFDLRPKTSPNDLLRVVPGLLAVQHQGGGKADQLFLRGFDADHGTDVAVFVDGVPINLPSHAHGQGFADLHWLVPEAIERIDVVKGPYDARFGDFATAGAVNIVTRERFESSSVQYTLGMFPTLGVDKLAAQGRFVGIAAPSLPGWAAKLHPWIAFEAGYDQGPFEHAENLQRYNLQAKLTGDVGANLKLGLFIQAYGSGWIGSGQIPEREVRAGRLGQFGSEDPSEGGLTERQMFTGFLKYKTPEHELDATVFVARYRLSLWNDFTFFLRDPQNGDEIEQDDARVYAGANLAYHFHRRWRSISFRTTIGANLRWDGVHVDRWNAESQNGDWRKRLSRRVDGSDLSFSGNDDNIDQLNVAGFLEEDVVFNKWFRALVALRADYFGFNVNDQSEALGAGMPQTSGTRQRGVYSPKATLVISPLPECFEIYLNYGSGFHTNMAQVMLRDGVTHTNPDGTGFTIHGIPRLYGGEVGARAHLWNRLDVAAAFWLSYLENETVFDADAAAFVPSDPTRRIGLDFEARARILGWLWADLDLAWANATAVPNGGNGGAVALAPKLYITGGLTAKHQFTTRPISLRGGLRFRYLGDRPAFDETSTIYQMYIHADPARVVATGFFVVDLYGALRWRWLEAQLMIQNLASSTWREGQFGNSSCTRDETYNSSNPNYGVCGFTQANRTGVPDVHYTPGVPFNLQLTLKAYF